MREIFQPHTTYTNDAFAEQPITIITEPLLVILNHPEDVFIVDI